jgi:hypothetical protein
MTFLTESHNPTNLSHYNTNQLSPETCTYYAAAYNSTLVHRLIPWIIGLSSGGEKENLGGSYKRCYRCSMGAPQSNDRNATYGRRMEVFPSYERRAELSSGCSRSSVVTSLFFQRFAGIRKDEKKPEPIVR